MEAPHLVLEEPGDIDTSRRREAQNTEWFALLSQATKRPGRWYRVQPDYDTPSAARNAAYDINSGRNRSLPGRFEACSRSVFDEESGEWIGALYVKFLGK